MHTRFNFSNKRINNDKILLSIIFVLITILFLMMLMPVGLEDVYISNYIMDVFCICVILILLTVYWFKNRFDIFDPIFFITAIYATLYFIAPMHDIIVGKYTWFGYELFQYGIKSSVIALVGYLGFYLLYFFTAIKKENTNDETAQGKEPTKPEEKDRKIIVLVVMIMYGICFAANVFYLIHSGSTNLLYVLSFGFLGQGGESASKIESIGFISMLSYSLPTVTLLYWHYGKSKALKIILFVPMLMLQVSRGFRFFVIQIAITFFAYYFINKKKRPRIRTILLFLVLVMVPVMLMTLFREAVRAGTGADLSKINVEMISKVFESAFWDNLRIYKNFYGMVGVIPSKFGYVYGRQMIIGTIVMVIPRIIWPNKISSYGGEGLKTLIGEHIADGQAYPNLGEYYYACGVIGVIICMAILGWFMKRIKVKGMAFESGGLNNIVFASVLGAMLQIIIRGYFPSNFWYVIFLLIPVWVIRFIANGKRK